MRNKKPVMILGCGPAGLFAAQAATDLGYPVQIFSRYRKSEMFGAQYLHAEVPGLEAKAFNINYILQGSTLDYAAKVYGPEGAEAMADKVSPARILGTHRAWDIREAYSRAWDRFSDSIANEFVSADWLIGMLVGRKRFSAIISSIPTSALCLDPAEPLHRFNVAEIWAIGDAPTRNVVCPVIIPLNTVVCNGEAGPSWYRASNVNGYCSAEWPIRVRPPIRDIARVTKPISTNCNCWLDSRIPFLRVGRYGTWTKGVLSHDAYFATRDRLS